MKDPTGTIILILKHYFRSSLFMFMAGYIPPIFFCHMYPITNSFNIFSTLLLFGIGSSGFFAEPILKHPQYLGFLLPKVIETLYKVLSQKYPSLLERQSKLLQLIKKLLPQVGSKKEKLFLLAIMCFSASVVAFNA